MQLQATPPSELEQGSVSSRHLTCAECSCQLWHRSGLTSEFPRVGDAYGPWRRAIIIHRTSWIRRLGVLLLSASDHAMFPRHKLCAPALKPDGSSASTTCQSVSCAPPCLCANRRITMTGSALWVAHSRPQPMSAMTIRRMSSREQKTLQDSRLGSTSRSARGGRI